jgi:threonine synthase
MAQCYMTHLECPKCGMSYDPDQVHQVCSCGSPLLVRYDMEGLAGAVKKEDLIDRTPSMWRYREFLPLRKEENIITLGEGMTPVIPLQRIGAKLGVNSLSIKDEGNMPGGTFKTRGAAMGVSRAKELGVRVLAMPTNGNAGGTWAAYSARAGINAYIVMPEDAPPITRKECAVSGAALFLVRGLISDAGKIVGRAVERHGWFDASTLKEPYRIEGKKTMGLEIAEQFSWTLPDIILYPTGGGVGIIGIYKALRELQEIGWIGEKMPRLVSVQASGCAPIVKAWERKEPESAFWENSSTIAFGLNVPKALGDFLILDAVYNTHGCAVAVHDREILQAQSRLGTEEGMFVCPEGAATLAAAIRLYDQGWINPDDTVLLLNTGTGLKYPETVTGEVPTMDPDADLPAP